MCSVKTRLVAFPDHGMVPFRQVLASCTSVRHMNRHECGGLPAQPPLQKTPECGRNRRGMPTQTTWRVPFHVCQFVLHVRPPASRSCFTLLPDLAS